MATLWCVASTFSSFAADNNKWKPLFGKNLENANYNPEVWSETDGVLGAVKDESIWTKDEYENFELDLDFKTDVGTTIVKNGETASRMRNAEPFTDI